MKTELAPSPPSPCRQHRPETCRTGSSARSLFWISAGCALLDGPPDTSGIKLLQHDGRPHQALVAVFLRIRRADFDAFVAVARVAGFAARVAEIGRAHV